MKSHGPSVFRNALQVSPERIAALSDNDLNKLMGQLLRAQSYKCGLPIKEIVINTEIKAKDEGCDAWSARPTISDEWLGTTDTCWQFKAGKNGKLTGEIVKPLPKEVLSRGGRYVLVASGVKNGKKGIDARLEKLTAEAEKAGLCTDKIEVIDSTRLTNWCNQYPAIAAFWSGRPEGLWSFDDWSNRIEHQVPWQISAPVQTAFDTLRAQLDFATGTIHHLHIYGQSGVGKSRFALEFCREATWRAAVVYIPDSTECRLLDLIEFAVTDVGIQLTIVADEVQPEQLSLLRASVERGQGRVRLITIGHSPSTDPSRTLEFPIRPLDFEVMRKAIRGWYPAMPLEHVDFVARFADGYVRLASLTAKAVDESPTMNVEGLLGRNEIRSFLDKMLGPENKEDLYVVAVLTIVGWTGDRQEEGKAIAAHLGRNWNSVLATVQKVHRELRIVQKGGRYRYISPTPLGIYLSAEAWETFPDLLKSLPRVLPSDGAIDAYYERLKSIANNPHTQEYAKDEISLFSCVEDFLDARTVRRWSALSAADPDAAAQNIFNILSKTTIEERKQIKGDVKWEIVHALVLLAWKSTAFHNAVKTLALLAETENEIWAHHAYSEFVNRFQILLGGTALPYLDRLAVLDELLEEGRPTLAKLVVSALAQAGIQRNFRMVTRPAPNELPEKEWQPNWTMCFDFRRTAIERLIVIAEKGSLELMCDLVEAVKNFSWLLRENWSREITSNLLLAIRTSYPETRETLRKLIFQEIENKKHFEKGATENEINSLKMLHERFVDSSLSSRIQQYIGCVPWLKEQEDQPILASLSQEILLTPEVLGESWSWLTSGDALNAWWLGKALAEIDTEGKIEERLSSLSANGKDLRLICGYINTRRQAQGDEWYNRWIKSQFEREPKPIKLIFEAMSRCGVTESAANILVVMMRNCDVDSWVVGQLTHSLWYKNLSFDILGQVLQAMTDTGHAGTAVGILAERISTHATEKEYWKPLALKLVTTTELIRGGAMENYYWKELADTLIPEYPKEIASAIFREQADKKAGTWFADHHEAKNVLFACAKQDAIGVWQVVEQYLKLPGEAYLFSIGFPKGILELMPIDYVKAWVAEKPEERAEMLIRFVKNDIASDDTLASWILETYGEKKQVAEAFFSEYWSGGWSGPSSLHWEELAKALDVIVANTQLIKLRKWAVESAKKLRNWAEDARLKEEEEELFRS